VRTRFLRKRQLCLNRQSGFPSQAPQKLANGILADADPACDLALSNASALESLNQPLPCFGYTRPSTRVAVGLT
jgi:hypothetical protein